MSLKSIFLCFRSNVKNSLLMCFGRCVKSFFLCNNVRISLAFYTFFVDSFMLWKLCVKRLCLSTFLCFRSNYLALSTFIFCVLEGV